MKRKYLLLVAVLLLSLLLMGCTGDDEEKCPQCDGSGQIKDYYGRDMECPVCEGEGYIDSPEGSSSSNGFINTDVFEAFFTVGNLVQVVVSALISAFTLWLGAKVLNYNIKFSQFWVIVIWQQIARIVFELFNQSLLSHWLGQIEADSIVMGILLFIVPMGVSFLYSFKVNTLLIKKVGRLKEKVGKRISWVGTFLMQGGVNIVFLVYLAVLLEGELPGLLVGIMLFLSAVFFTIAGILIARWRKKTETVDLMDDTIPPPPDDVPFHPGEVVLESEAVYRDKDSVWEALYSGWLILRERAIQYDGELKTSQRVVDMQGAGGSRVKLRIPLGDVKSWKVSGRSKKKHGMSKNKEKYLSIKYRSQETGKKKKAQFIFDRRYIDKYVSSLALGDIAEDELPMGLSHVAARVIERMPGRYTGEEGYYDIWESMIETMRTGMKERMEEDLPLPPDDMVHGGAEGREPVFPPPPPGSDRPVPPPDIHRPEVHPPEDGGRHHAPPRESHRSGDPDRSSEPQRKPPRPYDEDQRPEPLPGKYDGVLDWWQEELGMESEDGRGKAHRPPRIVPSKDDIGTKADARDAIEGSPDHERGIQEGEEDDSVRMFFSAVRSYEKGRYDEALAKYEIALNAGLGIKVRGKMRDELARLKMERSRHREEERGSTVEWGDAKVEEPLSRARHEDEKEIHPAGSGDEMNVRKMSICPYCGERLDFPKPPRFCPFCEEQIMF